MREHLHLFSSLSLTVFLLAASSPGQAQPTRPWVDPPPEAGSSNPSPSSAPEARPTPALRSSPPAERAATGMEVDRKGQTRQEKQEASSSKSEPVAKSKSRKATAQSKVHQPSRVISRRADRSRQATQRRENAKREARGTQAERIREGVNSGLEVMTLRTIEFPDGRRMQILTRPRPGAISELMDARE